MSILLKLIAIVIALVTLFLLAVVVVAIVDVATKSGYSLNAGRFAGLVILVLLLCAAIVRIWRRSSRV